FGFVPRLLLGAFFGYLLYWSKSIWVSAFAHALNNSIVVATAYLTQKELITINVEEIGISTNSFHWIPLVSAVIFIILTVYCKRIFFYPSISKIKPLKRNIN
ncbi:MAG: CPBP family intramembrane metalloprotease, partial [Muribaculaceae bacterium]|nr:CPBP family intramembrane metalloprotease [Muribaculaceae bacterium]